MTNDDPQNPWAHTTPIHKLPQWISTKPQDEMPQETSAVSSGRTSQTLRDERSRKHRPWWLPRLGAGIFNDVRSRLPWYKSDWTDAWNYRVVPATALIFFAK